jgi:hypothetical protein
MTDYLKKTSILMGIGMVIIISIWVVFLNKVNQPIYQEEVKVSQKNIKQKVVLVVDDGEGSPRTFEAKFEEGMTAFDLLKEKTEESSIVLKTKSYNIGLMIEAIGDKKNGESGKYWLYYVNGEMPQAAADKKEIRPGDKVEFKFEKSPF